MKKRNLWTGLLAIALVFTMTAVGCENDPGNNPTGEPELQDVVYESKDGAGIIYKLTITESVSRAAKGDTYVLIITYTDKTTKESRGTIITIDEDGKLELQPEYSGSAKFTITISFGELTDIDGPIAVEGGGQVTPQGTIESTDVWSSLTSLSQLDGSWKAPPSMSGTFEEGVRVNANYYNYIMTFNTTAKTMSVSGSYKFTFSGANVNKFWADFKEDMGTAYQQNPNITIDDATHTVTIKNMSGSGNLPEEAFTSMMQAYKINQTGKKLRLEAAEVGFNYILTKQ